MRYLRAFLLVCVAFILSQCCQLPARSISQRTGFVDGLIQETVTLESFYKDSEEVDPNTDGADFHAYCAATWIGSTELLTAYHCIKDRQGPHSPPPSTAPDDLMQLLLGIQADNDPTDATVYYSMRADIDQTPGHEKYTYWTAKVEKFDRDNDLALLYVPKGMDYPNHDHARVASSVRIGEALHIIGHPAAALWAYQQGYASAWRPVDSNYSDEQVMMLQVQAPIYYGNSGGPAFNDEGELVGVCSRRSTKVPDLGLFIAPKTVRAFLK